jgi:hypothetical protein
MNVRLGGMILAKPCGICEHERRAEIDAAISSGSASFGRLAERFGLPKTNIWRHRRHIQNARRPASDAACEEIAQNIAKLIRALERVKRSRGELAEWLQLDKATRDWGNYKLNVIGRLNPVKSQDVPTDPKELDREIMRMLTKMLDNFEFRRRMKALIVEKENGQWSPGYMPGMN